MNTVGQPCEFPMMRRIAREPLNGARVDRTDTTRRRRDPEPYTKGRGGAGGRFDLPAAARIGVSDARATQDD